MGARAPASHLPSLHCSRLSASHAEYGPTHLVSAEAWEYVSRRFAKGEEEEEGAKSAARRIARYQTSDGVEILGSRWESECALLSTLADSE